MSVCPQCGDDVPACEAAAYNNRCENCFAGSKTLPPRTGWTVPLDKPPVTAAPRGEEYVIKGRRSDEVRKRISDSVREAYARRQRGKKV